MYKFLILIDKCEGQSWLHGNIHVYMIEAWYGHANVIVYSTSDYVVTDLNENNWHR